MSINLDENEISIILKGLNEILYDEKEERDIIMKHWKNDGDEGKLKVWNLARLDISIYDIKKVIKKLEN